MSVFKIFKKTSLSSVVSDAFYLIKGVSDGAAKAYITDDSGNAIPIKNTNGDITAGTGINVAGDLSSGNAQISLTGQALTFHSLSTNGLVYRNSGVIGARTITASTGISITNGNGVSGNPTITNSDRGSSQSIFKNIANSGGTTQFSASSNSDSIRFAASGSASVTFNAATKTITFSATDTNTTYSAGSGLSLSGTSFSHSDTSSQASVNNSNGAVIQSVTLDTYGHITGLSNINLDGRFRRINSGVNTSTGAFLTDGGAGSIGYGLFSNNTAGGTLPTSYSGIFSFQGDEDGRNFALYKNNDTTGSNSFFVGLANGAGVLAWREVWHSGSLPDPFSLTSGNAILADNTKVGNGTTGADAYVNFSSAGAMSLNSATGLNTNFTHNGSITAAINESGITSYEGIRTLNPNATSFASYWRLGGVFGGAGSSPDNRLRVQVGNVVYDIPAIYVTTV